MSYIEQKLPYVIIIAAVLLMCGFSFWKTATPPDREQIASGSPEQRILQEPVDFEELIRSKENEFGFRLVVLDEVDQYRINPRIVMEKPRSKEDVLRVLKEIHRLSLIYFQSLPERRYPGFTNTLVYCTEAEAKAFEYHIARLQTFSNELLFTDEMLDRIDWKWRDFSFQPSKSELDLFNRYWTQVKKIAPAVSEFIDPRNHKEHRRAVLHAKVLLVQRIAEEEGVSLENLAERFAPVWVWKNGGSATWDQKLEKQKFLDEWTWPPKK